MATHEAASAAGAERRVLRASSELPLIDLAEVDRLVAQGRRLVVFDQGVYDIRALLFVHPGGEQVLREHLGKDVSSAFRGLDGESDHKHSSSASKQMRGMLIGWLTEDARTSQEPAESPDEFRLDPTKPVVFQVGHLGFKYESWVWTPDLTHHQMRFFEHPMLELLSWTPWWLIPLVWLPIAFAAIQYACMQHTALSAACQFSSLGVLLWTFLEYLLHRFVFHRVPSGYWGITAHFLLHGVHHKLPADPGRLVFPPVLATPFAAANLYALLAVLPENHALCVFSGMLLAYVCYDLTHYALHHADFRHTPYLGRLKSTHLAHHYKDHTTSFGLTSPLFDLVFQTQPRATKSDQSARRSKDR